MKKTIKTALLLCLTVFILFSAVSCNGFVPFETGTAESNGSGIADILTEKVDGGTRITIKYANSEKEDAVFIIPDEQKESTELKDREIIKVEVIDGYLWVYYTDAPEEPVNVGRLSEEDMPPEETTPEVTTPEITPPDITTPEQTTPEIPPVVQPDYNLPEKIDMQGYTYKAYVRKFAGTDPDALKAQINNGNNRYECIDFWVDEENSEVDAISYAVYQRNKKIEEDYNCKIQQVPSDGDQIEHLVQAYVNGDGYDLTIIMAKRAAQAATQNLLRNLKDMTLAEMDEIVIFPRTGIKSCMEVGICGGNFVNSYLSGEDGIQFVAQLLRAHADYVRHVEVGDVVYCIHFSISASGSCY